MTVVEEAAGAVSNPVGASGLNGAVQLIDLVNTFDAVRATRSRKAKIAAVAASLRLAADDEVFVVATYLSGSLTQRRTGVGWRSMSCTAPFNPEAPTGFETALARLLDNHQLTSTCTCSRCSRIAATARERPCVSGE